jgi:hypothetical protein
MWRTLAFGLALIGISAQVKLHAETCPEQVSREIAEMRKQQDALRSGPYENGPIQELGQCTRQALQLGLTFAARGPASERQAAKEEAANCLALRIEAISHSCYCRQLGADIGRDLDMNGLASQMHDVGSAYQRMTQAAARARQRAISNPLIQQYVAEAEKFRQCYDRLAINTLDGIAKKLDAVDPGDGTASGGSVPSVNAPVPGTNGPFVKAPATTAQTPTANVPQPSTNAPTVNTTPVNTAAPSVPATATAAPSSPSAGNCADLRNDIAAMDAQSNAMPGYLGMRVQLASLYNKLCGASPAQRAEYWYTSDGRQLGPVGAGSRPPNAAYAATQDIGQRCAGTANPSMCALAAGAVGNCKSPPSDLSSACAVAGGYGDPSDTVAATGGEPLPDARLTIGGRSYDVPNACAQALAQAGDGGRTFNVIKTCPDDLLAALGHAEGKDAGVDPTAFLNGLGPLLNKGFAPPGAAPKGGFAPAFCSQMQNNAQVCKQRQDNMVSCIPTGNAQQPCVRQDNTNMSGQAGAFGDCYQLYSRFAGMCRMNVNLRPQIASASLPKPPPPAPKPAPPPQAPKPTTGASQAPHPPQQAQMSPQCQQLVSSYVAAAQANDGPRALAGYNALKNAGGCGVLAKVDRPMPKPQAAPADDPRFIARGATPLSDQVVGGCDASPAECQRRVQQLRAGVSPEAQAALVMNAISIGLQLGATVANGMAATMPQGGGGTNMNSIGNRPVQHTYGQGSPTYRTPRNTPSDITGTK